MPNQFQLRRDTATNWASANPVLAEGEMGLDLTAGRTKIGDGFSVWTSLNYTNAYSSPQEYLYPISGFWPTSNVALTQSNDAKWPYVLFPKLVDNYVSRIIPTPQDWPACNIDLDYVKITTATEGSCVFSAWSLESYQLTPHGAGNAGYDAFSTGADNQMSVTQPMITQAADGTAGHDPARVRLGTMQILETGPGRIIRLVVGRNGTAGADTFAATCGLLAVRLTPNFS